MELIDKKLLNRVYQDAHVGMQSIDKILKKIEDCELKRVLKKQYDLYEKMADKCDALAVDADAEVKDNNVFKKMKLTTMMYMSLWMDKSHRHICELMITGTVMGIVDTIKVQSDCADAKPEYLVMVAEFRKLQEDFYEKLKKQLAKV